MKYEVGQLLIWHDNTFEVIRKIENDKIYISHICGYTEQELDTLLDKEKEYIYEMY